MLCRTLADIEAAAARDYAASPAPYTQEQVNRFAALLAPHLRETAPAA